MAQQDTNAQKMASMAKHKEWHVTYWKDHNAPTDPQRFEDGFLVGWADGENMSLTRDSMLPQRRNENIQKCGASQHQWAFDDGYREGFDGRRCMGQEDTHDAKMAELAKHKEAHIAYWKAHGNRQTDTLRFSDGFISGWCDCERNPSSTVQTLAAQRRREHVSRWGDSPSEWAFDDGYREGFESRKAYTPTTGAKLENTHAQKTQTLSKHKEWHIAYWKEHNAPTDPKRYEDGFIAGWCDAENKSLGNITRDSMIAKRRTEHIQKCGPSDLEWAFDDGYREGFEGRRCMGQPDTHDAKMAELAQHRDAHVAYWKAHGNRQTDTLRFSDGFIAGWCDYEHNPSSSVQTLSGQRRQEHVRRWGDSPCEWAFDDGYREGFESRRCMKPPQPSQPVQPPTPAPTTQPTQPAQPAPSNPVSKPPESNPQPTQPAPSAQSQHQCTSECHHESSGPAPSSTIPPKDSCSSTQPEKATTTTACHSEPAKQEHCSSSDPNHTCNDDCKRPKKEGLLHRIEHALHLKDRKSVV